MLKSSCSAAVVLSLMNAAWLPTDSFGQARDDVPKAAFSQQFVEPPVTMAGEFSRPKIFISDLHFGLGKKSDGTWMAKEDFRWSDALESFLDGVSKLGSHRVDLIILGDLLELWQPPDGVLCRGKNADAGCTVAEMGLIVKAVLGSHAKDMKLLSDFAKRGENRIYVVPGNHDATMMLPEVWELVAAALNSDSGRVALVTEGVWTSEDGRIVAEHGHQIGSDVNKYRTWPSVSTNSDGTTYVERPWGERFVQEVFNAQEEQYEIIDNISPETVGVKYRIADRGLVKSAADIARFIAFNLFETSVAQKDAGLGADKRRILSESEIADARAQLKYKLFIDGLRADDPIAKQIQGAGPMADALKSELSSLAADASKVSDADVADLCERLALLKSESQCGEASAGALIESQLYSRQHVMREHLSLRRRTHPRMSFFIYGHTHQYEEGWKLDLDHDSGSVLVYNTGAFQRTIDEEGFLSLVKQRGLTAENALRSLKLEDLPACYSFVVVRSDEKGIQAETMRWEMSSASGSVVKPGHSRCRP